MRGKAQSAAKPLGKQTEACKDQEERRICLEALVPAPTLVQGGTSQAQESPSVPAPSETTQWSRATLETSFRHLVWPARG